MKVSRWELNFLVNTYLKILQQKCLKSELKFTTTGKVEIQRAHTEEIIIIISLNRTVGRIDRSESSREILIK